MSIGHHQEFRGIGFADTHAVDALAAAVLRAVGHRRNSLDKAAAAEGDHHSLMGDFFNGEVHDGLFADLGAAVIAVLGFELADFFFDQEEDLLRVGQQIFQVGDGLQDLGIFIQNLAALQVGQAAQLHIQDGLGLFLRQAEIGHQVLAGGFGRLRFADGLDDGIDMVQGNLQAFQDVSPGFGLCQLKLGAAGDDFLAEIDIILQGFFQADDPGLAVHQRQHVDEEGRLHGGIFVELV